LAAPAAAAPAGAQVAWHGGRYRLAGIVAAPPAAPAWQEPPEEPAAEAAPATEEPAPLAEEPQAEEAAAATEEAKADEPAAEAEEAEAAPPAAEAAEVGRAASLGPEARVVPSAQVISAFREAFLQAQRRQVDAQRMGEFWPDSNTLAITGGRVGTLDDVGLDRARCLAAHAMAVAAGSEHASKAGACTAASSAVRPLPSTQEGCANAADGLRFGSLDDVGLDFARCTAALPRPVISGHGSVLAVGRGPTACDAVRLPPVPPVPQARPLPTSAVLYDAVVEHLSGQSLDVVSLKALRRALEQRLGFPEHGLIAVTGEIKALFWRWRDRGTRDGAVHLGDVD
jgi:hypothetical protein